jgi:hypothetical protein
MVGPRKACRDVFFISSSFRGSESEGNGRFGEATVDQTDMRGLGTA